MSSGSRRVSPAPGGGGGARNSSRLSRPSAPARASSSSPPSNNSNNNSNSNNGNSFGRSGRDGASRPSGLAGLHPGGLRPLSSVSAPGSPRSPRLPSRSPAPYSPPLLLTVRFSAALPDLHLDIPHPTTTSVVALKHLIRKRLEDVVPQPQSSANKKPPADQHGRQAPEDEDDGSVGPARRRLRFVHAGKILPDGAVLGSQLKNPQGPPRAEGLVRTISTSAATSAAASSTSTSGGRSDSADPKGKGKAVEGRDTRSEQRVYVICSIGDVLSEQELAAEAEAAAAPVSSLSASNGAGGGRPLRPKVGIPGVGEGAQNGGYPPGRSRSGTTTGAGAATPRGFDRLLSAGFTAGDVNSLRLQFRSIQAARHTPDTMPSPDSLRSMEDAWIDNNNTAGPGAGGGMGGGGMTGAEMGGGGAGGGAGGAGGAGAGGGDGSGGTTGGDEMGVSSLLDVMIPAMLIGFVMPLMAVLWLVREEGLLSKRWQVLMTFGFALSLTIGMTRAISGDG